MNTAKLFWKKIDQLVESQPPMSVEEAIAQLNPSAARIIQDNLIPPCMDDASIFAALQESLQDHSLDIDDGAAHRDPRSGRNKQIQWHEQRLNKKRRLRFFAHTAAMAALDHPGVARLLDAGVDKYEHGWMQFERLQGATLKQHLVLGQPDTTNTLQQFAFMLAALDAAHAQHISHNHLNSDAVLMLEDAGIAHPLIHSFRIQPAQKTHASDANEELFIDPELIDSELDDARLDFHPHKDLAAVKQMLIQALYLSQQHDLTLEQRKQVASGETATEVMTEALHAQAAPQLQALLTACESASTPGDARAEMAELIQRLQASLDASRQAPPVAHKKKKPKRQKKTKEQAPARAGSQRALPLLAALCVLSLAGLGYFAWQARNASNALHDEQQRVQSRFAADVANMQSMHDQLQRLGRSDAMLAWINGSAPSTDLLSSEPLTGAKYLLLRGQIQAPSDLEAAQRDVQQALQLLSNDTAHAAQRKEQLQLYSLAHSMDSELALKLGDAGAVLPSLDQAYRAAMELASLDETVSHESVWLATHALALHHINNHNPLQADKFITQSVDTAIAALNQSALKDRPRWHARYSLSLHDRARQAMLRGQSSQALAALDGALEQSDLAIELQPDNLQALIQRQRLLIAFSQVYLDNGQLRAAQTVAQQAVQNGEVLLHKAPRNDTEVLSNQFEALHVSEEIYRQAGEAAIAASLVTRQIQTLEQLSTLQSKQSRWSYLLAEALLESAEFDQQFKQFESSTLKRQQVIDILEPLQQGVGLEWPQQAVLVKAYLQTNRAELARPLIDSIRLHGHISDDLRALMNRHNL